MLDVLNNVEVVDVTSGSGKYAIRIRNAADTDVPYALVLYGDFVVLPASSCATDGAFVKPVGCILGGPWAAAQPQRSRQSTA